MPIQQPSNQIKLTNVAIVRLKKGKKRYELACYKNKVLEYRSGVEADLDEVLQIHQVFTNVSKGAVAPHADLQKSFGASATQDAIILEILQKGELQVGEKERNAKLEMVHNEVVSLVASMCVDPETKRVYTASMIEKALQELSSRKREGEEGETGPGWHGVTEKKSSKAQALEAIKALVHHQPIAIARARMRLRIVCPKRTKEKVQEFVEEIEEDGYEGGNWECVGFVEPGRYKGLVDLVGQETKGKGRVEVLDTAVVHEGDS
ncbi:hypothetical protein Q9L58_008083 [Maublancomyces gigas]|uniref:Shwachman-Bodian-Diamond syndrome protein n=1 Tax=Discina gigas TaxID=1032678 RepID=A0ABR3GAM7_9PEZI